MEKTILITGATDGIGLETARSLAALNHTVLLHGRSRAKLDAAARRVGGDVETYLADLTHFDEVVALADAIKEQHTSLDVLINNAGVFKMADPMTRDGLDARFVVNTIAPYLLTQQLRPLLKPTSRVINLSSAAQAPVNLDALHGKMRLDDMGAYAQSKLALTMWSIEMAHALKHTGVSVVAVNPGSLLASKMVKEAFGVPGADLSIGSDILCRAALSDEFADASGRYYDNDAKRFADPQAEALNPAVRQAVVQAIESLIHR